MKTTINDFGNGMLIGMIISLVVFFFFSYLHYDINESVPEADGVYIYSTGNLVVKSFTVKTIANFAEKK